MASSNSPRKSKLQPPKEQTPRQRLLWRVYRECGENQSETARRLEVQQSYVSNVLRGKMGGEGGKLTEALARYFGISMDQVAGIVPLEETDSPNRDRACRAATDLLGISHHQASAYADAIAVTGDPSAIFWFDQIRARFEAERVGHAAYRGPSLVPPPPPGQ